MPHITLDLSDDLFKALGLCAKQKGVKSKRAVAVQLLAQALGVETDTPATWGGWRNNSNSLKALTDYADRITDSGRNAPGESD